MRLIVPACSTGITLEDAVAVAVLAVDFHPAAIRY